MVQVSKMIAGTKVNLSISNMLIYLVMILVSINYLMKLRMQIGFIEEYKVRF